MEGVFLQLWERITDGFTRASPPEVGMPGLVAHPARALEIVTGMYVSAREGRWVSRTDLADPALRGALAAPVIDGRPGAPAGVPAA